MSTTAKVELVQSVQAEFGLVPALTVLGLPRATWYYRAAHPHAYEERHAHLRRPLEQIACDHPEYGYRRTTTELRARLEVAINQKVVRRLHRCWGLPLMRQTQPPRPSGLRQVITAAGDRVNLLAQLEVGTHPRRPRRRRATPGPRALALMVALGMLCLPPHLLDACELPVCTALGQSDFPAIIADGTGGAFAA